MNEASCTETKTRISKVTNLCQTATFATNYTPGNKAAGTSLIMFNALSD